MANPQVGNVLMKLYPRALEGRIDGANPVLSEPRAKLLRGAAISLLLLQTLFLGLFAYIFGSLFHQGSHIHNMNMVFVDYDGGRIGNAIREAYANHQGDGFPTITERNASDFINVSDLRTEICHARYWAAIYISPGASDRFQNALLDESSYNRSDVLTYIWNEARYPAISDSMVSQNIQILSSDAKTAFVSSFAAEDLSATSRNMSAILHALADPWTLVSANIQPTVQGSRLIYNTLVIILIMIQEFFYVGALNTLYVRFNIYTRIHPLRIIVYRTCISLFYTFLGSLCTAGAIWAFRANWNVNSNQFALTWATLWLFAHVNYLTLDVFTIWTPIKYLPMFFISWIVFNSTSILVPFDLMPGFYHWSYAIPANAVYRIMVDVWSGGCNPQVHYALPILMSWEVVSLFLSSLGVYRRCHLAVVGQEAEEKAFRIRMEETLRLEREQVKGE